MSLLHFSFTIMYIIRKMLVLLKNYQNYLKENIFECFSKKHNKLSFFIKNNLFHNI